MMVATSNDIGEGVVELFGVDPKKREVRVDTGTEYRTLDVGMWLPFAASHYKISPDIRNYIMVPVPSLITELPNTNGDSVSKEELLKFNPEYGMQAYRTWKGKPVQYEHDNQNIQKAKGVILDVYLRKLKGFGRDKHFKLVMLLAFDKTKDPMLCNQILSEPNSSFSVGMYFDSYSCSICGSRVGKNFGKQCLHTKLKQPTYISQGGKLAYRNMHDVVGFECSFVRDGAFVSCMAPNDYIMNR